MKITGTQSYGVFPATVQFARILSHTVLSKTQQLAASIFQMGYQVFFPLPENRNRRREVVRDLSLDPLSRQFISQYSKSFKQSKQYRVSEGEVYGTKGILRSSSQELHQAIPYILEKILLNTLELYFNPPQDPESRAERDRKLKLAVHAFVKAKGVFIKEWIHEELLKLLEDETFLGHFNTLLTPYLGGNKSPIIHQFIEAAVPKVSKVYLRSCIQVGEQMAEDLYADEETFEKGCAVIAETLKIYYLDRGGNCQEARRNVQMYRGCLLGCLRGLNTFFSDLETTMQEVSGNWVDYTLLMDPKTAQDIVKKMQGRMQSMVGERADSLGKHLHSLFSLKEEDSNPFMLLISYLAAQALETYITPHYLAGFIQNTRIFKANVPAVITEHNYDHCVEYDAQFNIQLCNEIGAIGARLCNLGIDSQIARMLGQMTVNTLLAIYPEWIGEKIQCEINRWMHMDFNTNFFLFLEELRSERLHYSGEQHQIQEVTQCEIVKRLNEYFLDSPYKERLEWFDGLSNTIVKNLLMIVMNKHLFRLLMHHVIEGMMVQHKSA